MNKVIGPMIILLATTGPIALTAQSGDLVTVFVPQTLLQEGDTTKVQISVLVKEGYHIQANVVDDESLIPTTLVIDPSDIIVVRKKFPRSKKFKLEGTDTFLNVYGGQFPIQVFLTPSAASRMGKYKLAARLRYQACNSRTCFFPRVVEFSIPVEIGQ